MPTARELLEQADALMRRNRAEATRGARESAAQGPRSIAPVPAMPVEPRLPPAPKPATIVPAQVADHAAAKVPDDAEIPVLDEAVAPSALAADDDVPVLTDAVDEIEVAAPVVDEGEPSDWLGPRAEDESILGPSPPSVAVVPPATLAVVPPPAHEAPQRAAPEIEDLSQRVYADQDADVTVRRPMPTLGAPVVRPPPDIEDLAAPGLADLDPDVTWTRPIQGSTVAPVTAPRMSLPVAQETAAASRAEAEPASGPRSLPAGDEFEALAEEIRMQVLQRIDMFTDTGLRERLGERLKPIVDRASADLVAAINQHVGEILRAYVAEAIEREIDRWRSGR
jgi:hypothetical protein